MGATEHENVSLSMRAATESPSKRATGERVLLTCSPGYIAI